MPDTFKDQLELSDNLLRLSELFPDASLKHISHLLRTSNNNFDATMEQLLNYDFIKEDIDKFAESNKVEEKQLIWVVIDAEKEKEDQKFKKWKEKRNKKNNKYVQNINETLAESMDSLTGSTEIHSGDSMQDILDTIKIKDMIPKFEIQDSIIDLLQIDQKFRDLVLWYLDQNSYDKLGTIYDIMLNFDSKLSVSQQRRHKLTDFSGRSFMDANNSIGNGSNTIPMSNLIRNDMKNSYTLTCDESWNELKTLIQSNPELSLPEKFYMLALNWFNKDVDKVLHLAISINSCYKTQSEISTKSSKFKSDNFKKLNLNELIPTNMIILNSHDLESKDVTEVGKDNIVKNNENNNFTISKTKSSDSIPLSSLEWRVNNLKNVRNVTNDKFLRSHYSNSITETKKDIKTYHETVQLHQVEDKIELAKKTFEIDFHSLSVQNAVYALENVLEYWWNSEMFHRNVENTKFGFTKAVHVEPFTIITGRGIHSGGGIPKIKKATLSYLNNHGYKYEESPAFVTVTGKRKN
jgi:hypothetical protein